MANMTNNPAGKGAASDVVASKGSADIESIIAGLNAMVAERKQEIAVLRRAIRALQQYQQEFR